MVLDVVLEVLEVVLKVLEVVLEVLEVVLKVLEVVICSRSEKVDPRKIVKRLVLALLKSYRPQ